MEKFNKNNLASSKFEHFVLISGPIFWSALSFIALVSLPFIYVIGYEFLNDYSFFNELFHSNAKKLHLGNWFILMIMFFSPFILPFMPFFIYSENKNKILYGKKKDNKENSILRDFFNLNTEDEPLSFSSLVEKLDGKEFSEIEDILTQKRVKVKNKLFAETMEKLERYGK